MLGSFPRRQIARLAVGVCVLLAAAPAWAQPPVWVAHGPHATVTLFGSVHLLPPGLDWEPPALKRALDGARDVWFEIPLDHDSALSATQTELERGMQPSGVTLNTQLSAAGRKRLARVAKTTGAPLETLQHLRPWLAEITLALAYYGHSGALQSEGVEQHLSATLKPTVARRALETVREQIEALSAASTADQVASLEQALIELEADDAGYKRLVKAWMAGDMAGLKREAVDPLKDKAPGEYKALVVERNHRWLRPIEDRLAGSDAAVIVVGMGHLIGSDGLPALLRARGYQVDGPR